MSDARNGKGPVQRAALVSDEQVTDNWQRVFPRVDCFCCGKSISKKSAYRIFDDWVCGGCSESLSD